MSKSTMDRVTIGQIRVLQEFLREVHTIGKWKHIVKQFGDRHDLSDIEAIWLAKLKI